MACLSLPFIDLEKQNTNQTIQRVKRMIQNY